MYRPDNVVEKPWIVYRLSDPRSGEIRYVGVTHQKLRYRLVKHLSAARNGRPQYVSAWIRTVLSAGIEPIIEILEEGIGNWVEAEMRQVLAHKEAGHRLTNLTDGGDGIIGLRHSEESKRLMSIRRRAIPPKKHTESVKKAISASKIGKKRPDLSKKNGVFAKNRPDSWSKENLSRLYLTERYAISTIAKEIDAAITTVRRLLSEYKIQE